jgi:hypothetical protein
MSEPPAQHHLRGDEWRPLADQIAANVKNFVDGVEALAGGGGDETVRLRPGRPWPWSAPPVRSAR